MVITTQTRVTFIIKIYTYRRSLTPDPQDGDKVICFKHGDRTSQVQVFQSRPTITVKDNGGTSGN